MTMGEPGLHELMSCMPDGRLQPGAVSRAESPS
jgi:hypothetical protein